MGGAVSSCCGLCAHGHEQGPDRVEGLEDVEFDTLLDTDPDQHQSWQPSPLTAEEIQRITQLKMQQVAEEEQRLAQKAQQWEEEERRLELEDQALYERQRQAAQAKRPPAPAQGPGLAASDSDHEADGDDGFESFLDTVRIRTLSSQPPPSHTHTPPPSHTHTPPPSHPHTPPTIALHPQRSASGSEPPSPAPSPSPQYTAEAHEDQWGAEWDDGGALATALQATANLDTL